MGQAVLTDHPRAMAYLERDLKNLLRFFARFDVKKEFEELISEVRGERL
jgi:RIO kinase 1